MILVKEMLKEKLAANAPQDKVKEGEQKADESLGDKREFQSTVLRGTGQEASAGEGTHGC